MNESTACNLCSLMVLLSLQNNTVSLESQRKHVVSNQKIEELVQGIFLTGN